jgi:hypothetical protein
MKVLKKIRRFFKMVGDVIERTAREMIDEERMIG